MSIKSLFFFLYNKISKYGNSNYSSKSEIKANIISNQILAFLIFILLLVGIVSTSYFVVMFFQNEKNLALYFFSYSILESSELLLAIFIFFIRNKSGYTDKRTFYDSIALYSGMIYITLLAFFAGESSYIYFGLLILTPLPFFILNYKQRTIVLIYEISITLFLAFSLWWLANYPAILPLPAYLDNYTKYIVIFSLLLTFSGTAFFLWRQSNKTEDELIQEQQKTNDLLRKVVPKLKKAEKKYKHLVENTSDIIFSLDSKYKIKTINSALYKHLHFKPKELIGNSFLNYLFTTEEKEKANQVHFVQEALNELLKRKTTATILCHLMIKEKDIPMEMNLTLEYSESHGTIEILGKASPIIRDKTINFLTEESKNYEITNDIHLALQIGQKLVASLKKIFSKYEISIIEIALREIIINAIEHGNLNINFEEKTKALENDTYEKFISKRQKHPNYKGKKIFITYSLEKNKVQYIIKDQGKGFNHRKFSKESIQKANDNLLSHGRGITMAKGVFDEVKYNRKGNQVTLVKFTNK